MAPKPHLTMAHLFLLPAFYGAAVFFGGIWRTCLLRLPWLERRSPGASVVRVTVGVVLGSLIAACAVWLAFHVR